MQAPGLAAVGGLTVPSNPGAEVPVAPFRALDTRMTAPAGPDCAVSFQVGGVNGIPAYVSAVTFNLTVTQTQSDGYITAYASGTTRPNSPNVNFAAGLTIPILVTVPVGADGKVTLYNRSNGTTQLIADVSGCTLAGTPAGSVYTWGRNDYGQLGSGTTASSTAPVQVTGLTGVTTVTTGGFTTYALLTDETVRAWGANQHGQLGNGTAIDGSTPVQVTGLTGVSALAANGDTAFALLHDGTVRAWRNNSSGELGNGTITKSSTTPVQVAGLPGVKALSVDYANGYALLTDGTIHSWGYNGTGQLGDGSTTDSSTLVMVTGLTTITTLQN